MVVLFSCYASSREHGARGIVAPTPPVATNIVSRLNIGGRRYTGARAARPGGIWGKCGLTPHFVGRGAPSKYSVRFWAHG